MRIWLNGEILTPLDARLPASNAGTLLGWGVFTTLGVWTRRPFALQQHLQRLRHDARELGLEVAFTDYELDCALYDTLSANDVVDGLARLTLTARGDGRWSSASGSDVSILAQNHSPHFDPLRPLSLGISPFSVTENTALHGLKSTSYGAHLHAWRTAQSQGLDDVVLLTSKGIICEASRANIFWVKEGMVFTPSLESGPLPGIARQLVLTWCRQRGIAAREAAYPLDALFNAEEVFVTASTTGPRPVAKLVIGGEERWLMVPGPLTQQLMARWSQAVRNGEE